jgi:PadR family transcriptional regulator PadR
MSKRGTEAIGAFEEQVLVAVIRAGADAYGMEVRRVIEQVTERDIAIGAVYSTLDRLEAKRFVQSRRIAGTDGSRRVFGVTTRGAQVLADTRAMRDRLWRGVDLHALIGRGRSASAGIP